MWKLIADMTVRKDEQFSVIYCPKREIMVNPLETIPPRFQYKPSRFGDQEGKKARVVNRNESYVPPLCVGVCG